MNMQYFDPILYTEVVFTETTEFKVQHPLQIFYMSVYIIFDAFIKRYEDMLLAHKEAKDVESLTPESAKKYTAIITSEPDGKGLDYISDHPWEGNLRLRRNLIQWKNCMNLKAYFTSCSLINLEDASDTEWSMTNILLRISESLKRPKIQNRDS